MAGEDERKARLAQALRDNLRRRKAQAREEKATDSDSDSRESPEADTPR